MLLAWALAVAAVGAPAASADLRVGGPERLTERLREYPMRTSALTRPVKTRVLLPDGYGKDPKRRYPVLYLLHGGFGNVADWTTAGDVEAITKGRDVIVVMPEGGQGGWYVDWYNGGRGGAPRWETFQVGELLPWVDRTFRTKADRGNRAVAGLSTGGFGAIHVAAAHPDLFSFAASYSGAVDLRSDPLVPTVVGLEAQADGGGRDDVFGDRDRYPLGWRVGNPVDLAANLRGVDVQLYTRDGESADGGAPDQVEQAVHRMTLTLHRRLRALRIRHRLVDDGPGAHVWRSWRRDLRRTLPAMERTFRDPPRLPRPLTFRSGVRTYAVAGYRVRVARDALHGFTRLSAARRAGFTWKGADPATVRTPAAYRPGDRYVVRIGGRRALLRADGRGRLRVRVPAGKAVAVRIRAERAG